MNDNPAVRVVLLTEQATPPEYKTSGSAGADLFAAFNGPAIVLGPGQRANIPTGICIEIPESMEAQVRPRSGLASHHGVTVLNSPGTIDSDYRGEVIVILLNTSETSYTIKSGDRIAQMVIAPVVKAAFDTVTKLGSSARGHSGLGSTGS
ncbi:dUTP diphosphatase [Rhizobium sp. Root1204]|uniref:dUTP diphosphatase n=1 Tax=Rhizobium sp. Root1204 TaxID=1736428 RepID=UPI0007149DB8|nr:dUTP diphosphatase [Rhizobium sp. Root1204]KQV41375.1 deoxyuridine 5'-triphosphate nucleotidohydrolase [Rhizobium sp. Root1204]